MLPGKKFTPEDVVRILISRFWLVMLPVALAGAATAVYVKSLPDLYRSETLILVVPQRVPESYVRSTVTQRLSDRIQAIRQEILSRTRLERLITDFNLYPEERRNGIMEDVFERIRTNDIQVEPVTAEAFRVSFVGRDRATVMKVAATLGAWFVDASLKDREVLAENTNEFLETQVNTARTRLMENEKRLADYRRKYMGQLPSQLEANLQAMQGTMTQLQTLAESANAERSRQLILEGRIKDLEAAAPPQAEGAAGAPGSATQQLALVRSALKTLEAQGKKGTHPDVIAMNAALVDLTKKAETEALQQPLSGEPTMLSPVEQTRRRQLKEAREALDMSKAQVISMDEEDRRLRAQAKNLQARIEAVPARESEMTDFMRDYKTLETLYGSLNAKKEESRISANLEQRQIGEQFRMLDPARLPEKPFSPNRLRLTLYGMAIGLAVGIALIVLLEYRDRSFKTDDEVVRVLGLPVLAVVPLMESAIDRRRALKMRVALHLACTMAFVACAAVLAYTLVR